MSRDILTEASVESYGSAESEDLDAYARRTKKNGKDDLLHRSAVDDREDAPLPKALIGGAMLMTMFQYALYSMLSAFFPIRAKSYSVTQLQIGFIFLVFELSCAVVSLFAHRFMNRIGLTRSIVLAAILQAIGLVVFGGVPHITSDWLHIPHHSHPTQYASVFTALCIVSRIWQGVCSGVIQIGITALLVDIVPRSQLNQALGLVETGGGLGLCIGPLFGALLFTYLGYSYMFYVLAIVIVAIIAPVSFYLLPKRAATDKSHRRSFSILESFRHIPVLFASLITMVGNMALSGLDPIMALYVKESHPGISELQISVIWFVACAVFMILAPVSSTLMAKYGNMKGMAFGVIASGAAYLLLGPAIFLPHHIRQFFLHEQWYYVCAFLLGVGAAFSLVPPSAYISNMVSHIYLQNTPQLVAAVETLSQAIGAVIGPFASSFCSHHWGYAGFITVFGYFAGGVGILTLLCLVCLKWSIHRTTVEPTENESEISTASSTTPVIVWKCEYTPILFDDNVCCPFYFSFDALCWCCCYPQLFKNYHLISSHRKARKRVFSSSHGSVNGNKQYDLLVPNTIPITIAQQQCSNVLIGGPPYTSLTVGGDASRISSQKSYKNQLDMYQKKSLTPASEHEKKKASSAARHSIHNKQSWALLTGPSYSSKECKQHDADDRSENSIDIEFSDDQKSDTETPVPEQLTLEQQSSRARESYVLPEDVVTSHLRPLTPLSPPIAIHANIRTPSASLFRRSVASTVSGSVSGTMSEGESVDSPARGSIVSSSVTFILMNSDDESTDCGSVQDSIQTSLSSPSKR